MAVTSIKSTYSLDVESVRTLEGLARRWQVSKSEVLRRALRIAAAAGDEGGDAALATLTRLQRTVRERGVDLADWGRDLKAERRAAERRFRSGSK
ncbi:MAG: ribbon-helix-helix protein, CopG family [Gemmatimonadetes bacterium]|nr:ribbon-helix-helix protein, CopG family [Gemmatimonadota bacterium]